MAVSTDLTKTGKIRRNEFIGNDNGISVYGFLTPGIPLDLGTPADPGGNVFRCNSASANYGADLNFLHFADPTLAWAGTVQAVGNAWDHVPPTLNRVDPPPNGSDIAVKGVPNLIVDVSDATLSTAVCPDGRVPGQ